jgi:hypothetical protein
MTNADLADLNLILAWALADAESKNTSEEYEDLRALVAACVRAGLEPATIYATIKTGRLLTSENMKLKSNSDIREWHYAGEEYERLVHFFA